MAKDKRLRLAISPAVIELLKDHYPDMTVTQALNHHSINTLTSQCAQVRHGIKNEQASDTLKV